MNNNDFKVICVFNFLISIQLPLKRAHIEVSMLKLNKVYIYIGKKLIYELPNLSKDGHSFS